MYNKLKALKENKKKGFTLVELIVVLVILAILAAVLIPALTGYIDKARQKSVTAETRQVVMAAQTIANEATGALSSGYVAYGQTEGNTANLFKTDASDKDDFSAVKTLSEVNGTINSIKVESGKVTEVKYTNNNYTCTYTPDGGYVTAKAK